MSKMLKTKSGRLVAMPSSEEDVAITAAALSDLDSVPLTDTEWEAARPLLRRGRPRIAGTKQPVKLRLDPDVLAALRASGPGWQTRVNGMLRREVLKA